ncbi:TPA: IS21 family transposase [Enterococcus faecium]|uniref:IS21 family transposase n=4 Tax=Enterococcus faecium TaxID=1352 RepID=A0AB73TLP3_ENTFC|nr:MULTISPECIES: IS21 family transposase [Enterococcus]AVJ44520.1 IS21 family transposase [Enterococcus faecium]AZQ17088.1 IS21 family transposase [Enterococcus faecium]EKY7926423.1 IS21 family transposase [Enterococcus faecium]EKZ0499511.1 IS21 family transposase [Enterococcus faecium]MBJ2301140.1 IS21 family transposase [Enterococcus faecium]
MRKDIREGVMIYVINEIKPNYAALAKQYDCDYRTVKHAYEEAQVKESKPPERKKRPSKLDPYREIIQDKIKDQCSAYSIFKFIEHKGFGGSYSLVKTYCRQIKQAKVHKATVRVEHSPGLSAQVDWKEDMRLISNQGEIFEFNIFLYVLPYSKKKYVTLTFDRKQDTLFECLDDAFYQTGGVPKEIWFDNMKTVVDHSRSQFSKPHFNKRFYAFSKDAGFTPIACRPFRPQTKGCVEALARTVDRLRVYNHEFYDAVELCHLVNNLCVELNNEVSQSTDQTPDERWQTNEKEHLHPYQKNLLNPYFEDFIRRKVTKEEMVIFRKCRYSVAPRYIGKEVEIELSDKEDQVQIYYNGELIRSHPLTTKQLNYHEEDYFQILKSDVMSHKEDDGIRAYTRESLKQYDLVEVADEE